MKAIYLDVCCWNRPFDDQTQMRIHLEAEAVLAIVAGIEHRRWNLVHSEVIDLEIGKTRDLRRRERLRQCLPRERRYIRTDAPVAARARELEAQGFAGIDALHLAAAEKARADVLLTTDDRLLRLARRLQSQLAIRVENPLIWLQDVVRE